VIWLRNRSEAELRRNPGARDVPARSSSEGTGRLRIFQMIPGVRACCGSGRAVLRSICVATVVFACTIKTVDAQPFQFPTANHALLEKGGEEKFFVGTTGKPWATGTFGCVRTDGHQLHEGLDIRCLQRDKHGEPTDPVMATADGEVAYINRKPGLSNYGNYVVVRHLIGGIEIYSLYAHLSEVRSDLGTGQKVKAGEKLAIMGRTANTHEGISKDRAHVHFELNLLVNDRYAQWHKTALPGQRNDHGEWNGRNLLGLDPRAILLQEQSGKFNLLSFVQHQDELCRVQVRKTSFPWLKRYAALVQPNPRAQKEGVAGYELALNFIGIPFQVIPRAASEMKGKNKFELLSVNQAEHDRNPCCHLVMKKGGTWALTTHGTESLDLLTY
jgi:murein DD-endopeptidase MepM/ murein hydrolase activator NlpD